MRTKPLSYITAVLAISFVVLWGKAQSYYTRSYDVYTLPVLYLDEGIDETQTDGITLAAPKLNGDTITIRSMSGAIFEFKRPGKKEDIYVGWVKVNSDNTVSLTGSIIRDLCQYTETGSFTTCGNGIEFSRGSEVRLSDNHRIYNLKLNSDRPTKMMGSGAVICGSTSQPCLFPGSYTTAQKNAFTYTNSSEFHIIFDSTLGTAQYFNPTAGGYYSFGSGSLINATTSVAGKVQISSTGAALSATALGSTGAENVLTARYTVTAGGSNKAGRVPVLSGSSLDESIMGTGTSSGKYLRGNFYGLPVWSAIVSTTNLTNSGSMTVNSFATGSLLSIKHTNTQFFAVRGTQENGHLKIGGGTAPTLASCGSSFSSVTGTDSAGKFTTGSGGPTSCALYFNKRFPTGRFGCYFTSDTATTNTLYAEYTSSGVILKSAGSLAGATYNYFCFEY